MIVTPFQLAGRAQFYTQLGQMTDAGVPVQQALEHLRRGARSSALIKALDVVQSQLQQGRTLASSLLETGGWLPQFDIALIGASEQSGRLPSCFLKLASYYEERARVLRRMLGSLAYPVFLIHMAAMIFPITNLQGLVLHGQVGAFLLQKILILAPLYLISAFAAFLVQGNRGTGIRYILEILLSGVPIVGSARQNGAISRLCLALEALINAGTHMIQAWQLAAAASGSLRLARAVDRFVPEMEAGRTPAELVAECRLFPREFAQQYHSAEISGKLDETLMRLHRDYEEQAARQTRMAVILLGAIVFGCVILTVAFQIISFYMGYFGEIEKVMAP